jgi:hypothetical protein
VHMNFMEENGGFVWANLEQIAKWGSADRPEGVRWTGTVHRAGCPMLGARGGTVVRLTHDQLFPADPSQRPQTCLRCGGDGRPYAEATQPDEGEDVGCPAWEREMEHDRHRWRDPVEGRLTTCPGWPP